MRQFPFQFALSLGRVQRWPDSIRALRHRNFRLFFFGQLISVSGSWMQYTAQQWLVYRITGSQLNLGLVTFAGYLPVLLFSLFMGVTVDRYPRRRLLLITQSWFMMGAAALAALTYTGLIQYEHLLILAFLLGTGVALDMPARQAFYMDVVEREDLLNAIALHSTAFNAARMIGPAVGGFVVASIGETPAFAFNSLSFLAVIAALLLMRLQPARSKPRGSASQIDLKPGLVYLIRERQILGLVSMIALFSLAGFPFSILFPVFARDLLKIGASGYGVLLGSQGLGALLGALSLAFFGSRIHKGRFLPISRFLFSIGAAAFALAKSAPFAMAALVLCGYALITQLALTNTLIQLMVADRFRGRVMSAYSWALGGFWPVGSLAMGALGDQWGARSVVLLVAAACILISLLGHLSFPETRSVA